MQHIYGTRMPLSFAQVCPGGSFIVGLGGTRVKAPRYIVPGDERHPRARYAAMLRFDLGQSYSRVTSVRTSGGRGLGTIRIWRARSVRLEVTRTRCDRRRASGSASPSV